jgi:hypothetical protein
MADLGWNEMILETGDVTLLLSMTYFHLVGLFLAFLRSCELCFACFKVSQPTIHLENIQFD